jgi:excisionase family DNA binding protein
VEHLLSVQEAAKRLGISSWTVYRLARNGGLPSVRLGRRRLFASEDLEDLVRTSRRKEFPPLREGESGDER